MSAFDVDDVLDIANGMAGLRGGAGCAANVLGAGAAGAAFAVDGAVAGAGVAGVVWGVTLREIGRGFGSGTAEAAYETSATAPAPRMTAVQYTRRAGPADEGANGITGSLCGESFKSLRLQVYCIEYVDKTPNVLEQAQCRNTAAKSRLARGVPPRFAARSDRAFHRAPGLVINQS
jgi:hypothetical protein